MHDTWINGSICTKRRKILGAFQYRQNAELRRALFLTHGTVLVETNPSDVLWGIGLSMDDPRAKDRSAWRGQNWLGYILTAVREELWKDPLYKDEVRKLKRELRRKTL